MFVARDSLFFEANAYLNPQTFQDMSKNHMHFVIMHNISKMAFSNTEAQQMRNDLT